MLSIVVINEIISISILNHEIFKEKKTQLSFKAEAKIFSRQNFLCW